MWTVYEIERTRDNTKFGITEDGNPLTHQYFLELLGNSKPFRKFYTGILAQSGFEAFFWENKPVTSSNVNEEYECNLINSNFLADKSADAKTFRSYFEKGKSVVSFPNLSKDAQLVVPCPQQDPAHYVHIGPFVRNCERDQIDDFWRIIAEQMQAALGDAPRWLSTSGLGVFWLHARIDSRPKYYHTPEYKRL